MAASGIVSNRGKGDRYNTLEVQISDIKTWEVIVYKDNLPYMRPNGEYVSGPLADACYLMEEMKKKLSVEFPDSTWTLRLWSDESVIYYKVVNGIPKKLEA